MFIIPSNFSPSGRAIYSDVFFTHGLSVNDPLYGLDFERAMKVIEREVPELERVDPGWWDYLWGKPLAQLGATVYGDAWTKVRAGRKVQPNELGGGNIRIMYWNVASLPAGNIGDVIVCGKIYSGDRNMTGIENHGALTSGGATAGGAYGTYAVLSDGISLGAVATSNLYLASTSFEAAGTTVIANSIALNFGAEAASDLFLCCTNDTEAFATAGRIQGNLTLVR